MALQLPSDFKDNPIRAHYPRQLICYDKQAKSWIIRTDKVFLKQADYLAVSYRQSDFKDQDELLRTVREACHALKLRAYWLDFECTGESQKEKNRDLYRIGDVFLRAAKTLILIKGDNDNPQSEGWLSWGGRVWTFPEALLSKSLW